MAHVELVSPDGSYGKYVHPYYCAPQFLKSGERNLIAASEEAGANALRIFGGGASPCSARKEILKYQRVRVSNLFKSQYPDAVYIFSY